MERVPSIEEWLKLFPPLPERVSSTIIDVPIKPIGKPRMTGSDAWKKRPPVMRYRAWKDEFKILTADVLKGVPLDELVGISWVAVMPMTAGWSEVQKQVIQGTRHDMKPDRDNIDKAIMDTLLNEDCRISDGSLFKRFCRINENPRLILRLEYPTCLSQ